MRKKKIKEEISKKENQIEAISELLERNKDVSPEIKTLIGVSLFFYSLSSLTPHNNVYKPLFSTSLGCLFLFIILCLLN